MKGELHIDHWLRLKLKGSYCHLPIDLGASSTKGSIIPASGPQPRQPSDISRAYSKLDANLQLKAIGARKSPITLEGDLKGKPTAEESARKRREQNRAS